MLSCVSVARVAGQGVVHSKIIVGFMGCGYSFVSVLTIFICVGVVSCYTLLSGLGVVSCYTLLSG
jgi:hypothetical protein